jgi:hypothetical protein
MLAHDAQKCDAVFGQTSRANAKGSTRQGETGFDGGRMTFPDPGKQW